MRVFAHCAALACAAAVLGPAPRAAQKKDPAAVLAAARQALGGEKKLAAVKSFTATGRTRQVRGDNLVPIEFEIFVELPDKYLRKDEIPAQETGPNASGFNGDELIVDPPPPAPMPDPARRARVTTLKQDFARLALGMFAGSFPAYPLTFTYVGEAEAPQGKADVLDARGPDNVTLRLFIHSETHLPVMVSWMPPARPAPGARPPGASAPPGAPVPPGASPAARGAPPAALPAAPAGAPPGRGAAPGTPAPRPEFRLYFADYRDVDGLQLPFRVRRATGADTTEETTFDRYRLNPKIDPRRFTGRVFQTR
jgi:hypothetical protein